LIDKKRLREKIQKLRDSIPPEVRNKKSRVIADKFLGSCYYDGSEIMLAYYPFRSEIDTSHIIKRAITDKKKIILPRVHKKELSLYYIQNPPQQLETGSYGIMEPVEGKCEPARLSEVELVIVPGVAFDRGLNRLGYGGGFYDRLLNRLNPAVKKVALCFNLQLVSKIPVSKKDIKVDVIITELEEIVEH
jgi:5-formyltetrahydrofolate cyclo-ligase